MNSFVYCWTDKLTNKIYVGAHKGSPDDGYICSSKVVKELIQADPNRWSRTIIANGDWADVLVLETKILKAAQAATDPTWYNRHNGDGKFYTGPHSLKTRLKLSRIKMGFVYSAEARRKMSEAKRGKKQSEETKEKRNAALRGRKRDPKAVAASAAKKRGVMRTPEQKQRIREARWGKK